MSNVAIEDIFLTSLLSATSNSKLNPIDPFNIYSLQELFSINKNSNAKESLFEAIEDSNIGDIDNLKNKVELRFK